MRKSFVVLEPLATETGKRSMTRVAAGREDPEGRSRIRPASTQLPFAGLVVSGKGGLK